MNPRPSLSEFVKAPEVSTAALHLEWHEVRRRVRRHRQVRVAGVAVAGWCGGLIAGYALRTPREPLVAGELAVAHETSRTFALAEGSEVVVAPGGSLELARADDTEVVIFLQQGRASFDVQKKASRRFVVKADAVEVRVVGTKFTVQREGTQVDVTVQRGIVEVREGEVVKRLVAGERWSRAFAAPEPEERGEATDEEDLNEPPGPTRSTPRHRRNQRTSPNAAPQTPSAPAAPTGGTDPLPALPTPAVLPETRPRQITLPRDARPRRGTRPGGHPRLPAGLRALAFQRLRADERLRVGPARSGYGG